MAQYIDKEALVVEIERRKHKLLDHIIYESDKEWVVRTAHQLNRIIMFIDTLEVKEVDLIIHTIIAECCDWLAMNTNLSHDEIEGCRNLMLTVKEEQRKAQKGKKV